MSLSEKNCLPCRGAVPPLKREEYLPLLAELNENWQVKDEKRLERSFQFDNFKDAMALCIKIADLAEQEGHHPDLLVRWGELKIDLWTHKIDGLTESDFILAAKIDLIGSLPTAAPPPLN